MRVPCFCSKRIVLTAAALACGSAAQAADPGADRQLGEMVVKSDKPAVPANLPATTEGVTAQQIVDTSNTVTAAETIQYLPSVHVRQRYIGDRNAIVQMRTNTAVSSAQTIVYADHLLLSNFTNNSFSTPPRWGMVSPEEIERVDVIYGPFSALYPGNSLSGIVLMTTRMPDRFEAHAKVDAFGERFKLYGSDKEFAGWHSSAAVGDRFGDWSLWMGGDHLDNKSHPMTFGNATRKTTPGAAGAGTFTVVDSARLFRDIDTTGQPRIITSSLGIDHTVQEHGKFKVAYDLAPSVRATYTLGVWQNTSEGSVDSYLRDATGRTIYSAGSTIANPLKFVRIDGLDYTVTQAAPSRSESEHWMQGLSLKSNTRGEWDWEAIASDYTQDRDRVRTAVPTNGYDSGLGAVRAPGTLKIDDGTGWRTLDLRGEWRPGGTLRSAHQVSFGYHYDRYRLSSDTYNVADWLSGAAGALNSNSKGKTRTTALYLQDAWRFLPDWTLVAGGRWEHWQAFDGSNYSAANVAPNPKNLVYGDRSANAFSPKAMLAYQASADWTLRGSLGKAYRFPTVSEMFQTYTDASNIKTNDPNLKAEHALAGELAAERALAGGLWRTSLFWEDKRDALISQSDTTSVPGKTISSIQNVDKIRTKGIEVAVQSTDVGIRGLDVSGSITYTDSIIERNHRNPAVVGRDQPRIPDWRATLVGTYHASDRLSYSLAGRFSGRQWAGLAYTDTNPNVYGTPGVSSYKVFDAKVVYHVARQWTASLGVNNIGNYKYYVQPNPYPQRTLFASVKFDY